MGIVMSGLNEEQAAAVSSIHGPLLVFAGAGSGKTRVITHRIKHMVKSGIPGSAIVAVTFTNKSAREMKTRLAGMMDKKSLRGIVVSTFHSLGNRILRKEIGRLPGYRVPFSILSQEDALNILTEIYRNLKLDPTNVKDDGIAFYLSLCKNSGMHPEKFAERQYSQYPPEVFGEIFKRYQKALVSTNCVDFDDLILLPRKILAQDEELLQHYQRRWRYFLVDEFQDTNPAQYNMLRTLLPEGDNICVVGDDDQSIYGWRGADVGIILDFKKHFPQARAVHLETNYRSTATILKAANAVIANNTRRVSKQLRPTQPGGDRITRVTTPTEVDEAIEVAERIHRMIIREGGRPPGDFAILYRTNFQSRLFEQELRKREIPLHVVGGYRFFDRREVKDVIAYLRVMANPKDEVSLKRILNRPKRGIGEGTLRKVYEYILDHDEENRPDLYTAFQRMMEKPGLIPGIKSDVVAALNEFLEFQEDFRKKFLKTDKPSVVLKDMLTKLNWEAEFNRDGDKESTLKARMLNLSEIVNMMSYFEQNREESGVSTGGPVLYDFLARVSMMAADNDEESPRGRVQLLTLHLAKGLEFPVVFLAGMEEGLFPGERTLSESADQNAALEEERRLFYVGITRAREKLFITSAASRRKWGEELTVEPSRFLVELPEDLVDIHSLAESDATDPESPMSQLFAGLKAMQGA